MKKALPLLFLAVAPLAAAVDEADVLRRLQALGSARPRLFWKGVVAVEPPALRDALLKRAEAMLAEPPVERVLIGRRLLDKSRTALSRVLHLGLAYRVTGEARFADRARREMLAAAAFPDWNPSHFLDVAEMTAALGIGYDWLYSTLTPEDRATIRQAILTKGLQPSLTTDGWSRAIHNWNQVCNAGMAIGAIAIAESDPPLAARMVARAVNTVPAAMHEYAPDGAYPEGASYWSYGTTFNVLLIAALETALGSDFGLTRLPGFLATADYMLHVYGPTGLPFSYSDAGTGRTGLIPALFWFASVRGDNYLLWSEWAKLHSGDMPLRGDRLDPLLPLWMKRPLTQPPPPPALSWTGHGATPVAFHRSGWDREATYLAIKGGSPATNHAHMDSGSFVLDALGVRWGDELGMQNYNSLETKGIDLWNRAQNSGRWKVFRLGTSAHSVLMVNGEAQRVDSKAPITMSKPGRTVVDLTETYRGQLAAARRGAELLPDRTVVLQDEFTAGAAEARIRWAMVTRAEVRVDGAGRATLLRDGKQLAIRVVEPAGAEVRVYSTDPPAPTDEPNPGTRLVGFEITAPAGTLGRIVVHLAPGAAAAAAPRVRPLREW